MSKRTPGGTPSPLPPLPLVRIAAFIHSGEFSGLKHERTKREAEQEKAASKERTERAAAVFKASLGRAPRARGTCPRGTSSVSPRGGSKSWRDESREKGPRAVNPPLEGKGGATFPLLGYFLMWKTLVCKSRWVDGRRGRAGAPKAPTPAKQRKSSEGGGA